MINKLNKYICLLLIGTVITSIPASAQTAEDSVKAVIDKMFAGMKEADTLLFKSTFTETAILQTFGRSKAGKTIITTETASDFAKVIATIPKGAADEQITFNAIKIDGALASVWTPYKFIFNGKFSHCGVNSFQLVRLNNEWKIQYLIDTRRKTNCE